MSKKEGEREGPCESLRTRGRGSGSRSSGRQLVGHSHHLTRIIGTATAAAAELETNRALFVGLLLSGFRCFKSVEGRPLASKQTFACVSASSLFNRNLWLDSKW